MKKNSQKKPPLIARNRRAKDLVKSKSRAQGIVEFALVLPILLTLLYGLLEAGRYAFIRASTITAARQAARYGSTTGINGDGIPYYDDCTGITAAATKVGFINTFDSVAISYDGGLDAGGVPIDIGNPACGAYGVDPKPANGDRVIVDVKATWSPIVRIVPLNQVTFDSTSERTILASVDIYVDATPPGFNADVDGTPKVTTVDVTTTPTNYDHVGQLVHYVWTLVNTGPGVFNSPAVTVQEYLGSSVKNTYAADCGAVASIPYPGSITCSNDYNITQADLDAGTFKIKAFPTGFVNNGIIKIISADQRPSTTIAKSGSPVAASRVGTTIFYTYTITNTGNVTLKPPYSVADDKISVTCSGTTNIAPNGTTSCSGQGAVTQTDVDNGVLVNNATASVIFNGVPYTSTNTATFTVVTPPILLEVNPPPIVTTPGIGTYTYTLSNDTNYDATGVVVSDNKVTIPGGACPTSLSAHSSYSCSGTYTFTQADIDAGVSIQNTAVVNGTMNARAITSNQITAYVGITQTKALSASLTATPSSNPLLAGNTILYTYTLTNSGNVTLKTPIAATDTKGDIITCSDQSDFIPSAPSRTCTGTYTVVTADLATGSVTTTGTATATFNNGSPQTVSAVALTVNTPTFNGPRFNISVTASPTSVTSLNSPVLFTYTFTNTGSVVLYSPYTVTASLSPIAALDCSLATSSIALGASTSCTQTYTVTSAGVKTNTISAATATTNGVTTVSANNVPQSASVSVVVCSPSTVTLTPSPSNATATTVTWTIVNNSGGAITIGSIHLDWANGKKLQTLTFASPTTTIYTGSLNPPAGGQTFSGSWAIASGATATVTAVFNNSTAVSDFTLTFSTASCSGIWSNP